MAENEDLPLRYEDLFRAPEKDGAVVSVRVHRRVKDALVKLAEKEGLDGVSELVRYLVAGYLMGKYQLVKPEPRVVPQPIFLNINLSKESKGGGDEYLLVKMQIDELLRESMSTVEKLRRGLINSRGNEYLRRLRERVVRYMVKAMRNGLEEEYEKLRAIHAALMAAMEPL